MDMLAHTLYGVTLCSKRGIAGGRGGNGGRSWFADATVWWAIVFTVLPDALSMGVAFIRFWIHGTEGNYFMLMDGNDIVVYRYMHSLIVAFAAAGLVRMVWKRMFVASLAWPLHVMVDALSHGAGKFQTTVFYPLSTWSPEGINWWESPGLMMACWLALPVIWVGMWIWRRGHIRCPH